MTGDQSKRAPYPGLRAFRREETDLFFGREDTINAMVDRLAATRFLAVLGSSGTGKSSLVRTGLLDALELGLMAKAGSRWKIVEFRPGGAPLKNLARRLLETENSDGNESVAQQDVDLLRAFVARGPRAIVEWCRAGHLPQGANLLLLVDQFEELFRYQDYAGREEAEAFVALLLESAREADIPIYVTITMRSEYLGACALIEGLADAINAGMFLTPRMTREHCHEAIVGPAAVCDIAIDPALVNRLLNDLVNFAPWDDHDGNDQLDRLMRRADQLPLLQYTLNRMWQRARERSGDKRVELTVDDYVAIEGLSGALNAHANQIFEHLGKARAPVVEWAFRTLTAGSTIADAVRRPTRLDDLIAACGGDEAGVRAVVDAFRAPGVNFLAPEYDPDNPRLASDTYIDISHESLIRQWKKLSEWVTAEGLASQQWRRLVDRFGTGEMLRGRELANLIAWRGETNPNAAWAKRYGGDYPSVIAYLDKSQREQNRKRIAMIVSVVGAFVLITGIAVYAILLRNDALLARNDAIAARNDAIAARNDALEKSAMLAKQNEMVEKQNERMAEQKEQIEKNQAFFTETFEKVLFSLGAPLTSSGGSSSQASATRRAEGATGTGGGDQRDSEQRVDETTVETSPASVDRITVETGTRQGLALTTAITLEQAARELHKRNAEDPGFRRLFVVALNQLGDVRLQANDEGGAERAFEEGRVTGSALLLIDPNDEAWRADHALSLAGLARVRVRRNDHKGALPIFRQAIDIERQLSKEKPEDDGFLKNLQDHLGNLGDIHIRLSQRGEALNIFQERLDVRQKRLAAHNRAKPRSFQIRYQLQADLSVALDRVGQLIRDEGNLERSRPYFDRALAIDRELYKVDSKRRNWQENLVYSLMRIGDLDFRLARYPAALPLYEEARDLQKTVADDPTAVGPLQTHASIFGRVGDINRRLKEFPKAITAHREELDLRRKILDLEQSPTRRSASNAREQIKSARRSVSSALDYLGNAYRENKDSDNARKAFNEQFEIDSGIRKDFPNEIRSHEDVAWSLGRLGDLDRDAGRNNEASKVYQEALGIQRELLGRQPENPGRMRALALILSKLGLIRTRLNDHTTALTLHHEELELRRKLYQRAREDTEALRDLSIANDRVGNVLRDMNDYQGAIKFYLEELAMDRSFVARLPNNLTALNDLQWTLNKIFDFTGQRLKDRQGSRKYLEEMIGIDRRLVDLQPKQPGSAQAAKGRSDEACQSAAGDDRPARRPRELWRNIHRGSALDRHLARVLPEDRDRCDPERSGAGQRRGRLERPSGWTGTRCLAVHRGRFVAQSEFALEHSQSRPCLSFSSGVTPRRWSGTRRSGMSNRSEDGKRKYADEIKDDFGIFRRLGLALPDMDRIERELGL